MKLTTPKRKQEILESIIYIFNDVKKSLEKEQSDYNYGRYTAMIDLLKMVEIYEKEE